MLAEEAHHHHHDHDHECSGAGCSHESHAHGHSHSHDHDHGHGHAHAHASSSGSDHECSGEGCSHESHAHGHSHGQAQAVSVQQRHDDAVSSVSISIEGDMDLDKVRGWRVGGQRGERGEVRASSALPCADTSCTQCHAVLRLRGARSRLRCRLLPRPPPARTGPPCTACTAAVPQVNYWLGGLMEVKSNDLYRMKVRYRWWQYSGAAAQRV